MNAAVTFTASASTHYRTSTMLGQSVTVQFTPVAIIWDFGAGPTGQQGFAAAASVTQRFGLSGSQLVSAEVKYSAAYKFAGQTNWTPQSGYIGRVGSTTVIVGRGYSPGVPTQVQPPATTPVTQQAAAQGKVRLVVADCKAGSRAVGCRG